MVEKVGVIYKMEGVINDEEFSGDVTDYSTYYSANLKNPDESIQVFMGKDKANDNYYINVSCKEVDVLKTHAKQLIQILQDTIDQIEEINENNQL